MQASLVAYFSEILQKFPYYCPLFEFYVNEKECSWEALYNAWNLER